MQVAGKTAFITGGGGGIGGGMAQAFVEAGARVVLADISLDHAREQAALLAGDAEVEIVALDVTVQESWALAKTVAEGRFGSVDILCNNAGISAPFKPLIEVDAATFERILSVNLTGVFNGIATFAPSMAERGQGHIVNVSSINGLLPNPGSATYSATKFAVTGLSDALRQELVPSGVGVSTIFPGLTRSRMAENDIARLALADPERAARIIEAMIEPVQLGRQVVRAVERDQPYVVSHRAFKAHLAARSKALLAAFD